MVQKSSYKAASNGKAFKIGRKEESDGTKDEA